MNPNPTNPPPTGSPEPLSHQVASQTVPTGLQALLSLFEGDSNQIKTVLTPKVTQCLVKYLEYSQIISSTINLTSSDPSVVLLILGTLNDLATSHMSEMKIVLKVPDCMKNLFALLEHQDNDIRRQVCEILSKIASWSSLVGYVIENPDHFKKIIKMTSDKDCENRKEAAEILLNATQSAHITQIIAMAEHGVLECLHGLTKQEADQELYEIGRIGVLNCARTYNKCVEGIFRSGSGALSTRRKKTHLRKKKI